MDEIVPIVNQPDSGNIARENHGFRAAGRQNMSRPTAKSVFDCLAAIAGQKRRCYTYCGGDGMIATGVSMAIAV